MMARSSVGQAHDGRAHLHRAVVPSRRRRTRPSSRRCRHRCRRGARSASENRRSSSAPACRRRRRPGPECRRPRKARSCAIKNSAVRGRLFGIGHQPLEMDARQVHREPRQARAPPPASARRSAPSRCRTRSGSGTSRPWRTRRLREAAHHGLVVGTTASRFTRVESSIRRSVFASPTMLKVRRMSSATPASMKTSTSPSFWQVMPMAPAADLHLADRRDLVRLDMRPVADALLGRACAWTRAIFASSRSRWMVTAGVSSSLTSIRDSLRSGPPHD